MYQFIRELSVGVTLSLVILCVGCGGGGKEPAANVLDNEPFFILKWASASPRQDAVDSLTGGQITDVHRIEDMQVREANEITHLLLTFAPTVIPHYNVSMQSPLVLLLDFGGVRWVPFFGKQEYPWKPDNPTISEIRCLPPDDDSRALLRVALTRPVRLRVREQPISRQLLIELKPSDGLASLLIPTGRVTNPDNGHQYEIVNTRISWEEAKAYAENSGGYLATITSQEEQDWIYKTFWRYRFWLGGTDEASEGEWRWVTGEEWKYTNWWPAPNNMDGNEHALEMWMRGYWNDLPADSKSYPDSLLIEFGGNTIQR